jgi:hypothetical protein
MRGRSETYRGIQSAAAAVNRIGNARLFESASATARENVNCDDRRAWMRPINELNY